MRQKIYNLSGHPEQEALQGYAFDAPEGVWRGRLDHHAWGKSANLLCYFTDVDSGNRYRLSVFSRGGYKPYGEGPAFDEEETGSIYEITTAMSRNGFPKFMSAVRLDEVQAA